MIAPLALAGCGWSGSAPKPAPQPHFLLGAAYQADGFWYYPAAHYHAEETGLASILPDRSGLTADGEAYDPGALTAAHQTLQLPAIARLTDLDTGRSVTVRINDRGPASPSRLVAVTPRTAALLGFPPSGVARVRLTVLEAPSRAVAAALHGDAADHLEIAAAPRGAVDQVPLAAPGQDASVRQPAAEAAAPPADPPVPDAVPDRLPEDVTQAAPEPGSLYIRMGTFSQRQFAERQRQVVAFLDPTIERRQVGRSETYRVGIGPFGSVAEADRVLAQVIRAGVPDARIVVE